jgi:hypothetical protein
MGRQLRWFLNKGYVELRAYFNSFRRGSDDVIEILN